MLTLKQWSVIVGSLALFLILYFGCETHSPEQQQHTQQQQLQLEPTDINSLEAAATRSLSQDQLKELQLIQNQRTDNPSQKTEWLKRISGFWYRVQAYTVAGHYAEEVAKLENTDNAWSIAGATHYQALRGEAPESLSVQYSAKHALQSFENAVSLSPDQPAHQVNLALVMIDAPQDGAPMKGIFRLREIAEKYPNYPGVFYQLGDLSIRSGQWEKARSRFEKVIALEPDHAQAHCKLVKVYEALSQPKQAQQAQSSCQSLQTLVRKKQ